MSPKRLGSMTFRQAAEHVLKRSRHPMNCSQIVEAAIKEQLLPRSGKTPQNTLNAVIRRDIKNLGRNSPFVEGNEGYFYLRKH